MHERSVLASEMDATLGRDGGRLQFAVLARQEQRERTARPRMMSQLQLAVWRTMPGVFSCGWMRARWRSTSAARSRCGMLARRRAGCPHEYDASITPGPREAIGFFASALSDG